MFGEKNMPTHGLHLVVSSLHEDVLHELSAIQVWGETYRSVLEQQYGGDVLRQGKPSGLLTSDGDFAPAVHAAHVILQHGFL